MLLQLSPNLNFELDHQHARKLKVEPLVYSPCFKGSAEGGPRARGGWGVDLAEGRGR
jgi:hypothetical protein